ncbi:MOSC domain-containing protein [Paenibacillus sp. CC-CFT747]|nr:MOSC domain-containing protein [Paenibacillus sp. CC-CFT747]
MKAIGTLRELFRYPVKSLAGERLETADVEEQGLAGDRVCAFYDDSREGWSRFFTARNLPEMQAYRASLDGEGQVRVTNPEGQVYGWDEKLLAELQKRTPVKLSLSACPAPHPEVPGLLSVDEASLLIVTDAALSRLESGWGRRLDPRRFRPNLILALTGDAPEEESWIGKRLEIGGALLRVDGPCTRCPVIAIDPDTLSKDPSLTRKLHEDLDMQFGLYASVVRPGPVQTGDKVRLLDGPDLTDSPESSY